MYSANYIQEDALKLKRTASNRNVLSFLSRVRFVAYVIREGSHADGSTNDEHRPLVELCRPTRCVKIRHFRYCDKLQS